LVEWVDNNKSRSGCGVCSTETGVHFMVLEGTDYGGMKCEGYVTSSTKKVHPRRLIVNFKLTLSLDRQNYTSTYFHLLIKKRD